MNCRFRTIAGEIAIVWVSGRIEVGPDTTQLETILKAFLGGEYSRVLVDVADAETIDGIDVIFAAQGAVKEQYQCNGFYEIAVRDRQLAEPVALTPGETAL